MARTNEKVIIFAEVNIKSRNVFMGIAHTPYSYNLLRNEDGLIDGLTICNLVKIARFHALLTGSSCIIMSFPDGKILYKSEKLLFLDETTGKDKQRDCENPYWEYVQEKTLNKLLKLRTEFLHYSRKMDIRKDELYYSSTDYPIILKGKEFYINQKFVPMVIDSERKIQIGMLVYSTSKREKMESCVVNESGNFLKYDFETEEYEDFNPKANLTKTEKVILGRMKKWLSNDAIANNLNISAYTVKAHKRNIFKKLNVRNTTEALAIADRYNLLSRGG